MSYIVSASKNIKVNADQNISIKELIANQDRSEQPPYFKLSFEPTSAGAPSRLRVNSHGRDGVLSDGGLASGNRDGGRVSGSKSHVGAPQVINVEQIAQQMYQTSDKQLAHMTGA